MTWIASSPIIPLSTLRAALYWHSETSGWACWSQQNWLWISSLRRTLIWLMKYWSRSLFSEEKVIRASEATVFSCELATKHIVEIAVGCHLTLRSVRYLVSAPSEFGYPWEDELRCLSGRIHLNISMQYTCVFSATISRRKVPGKGCYPSCIAPYRSPIVVVALREDYQWPPTPIPRKYSPWARLQWCWCPQSLRWLEGGALHRQFFDAFGSNQI